MPIPARDLKRTLTRKFDFQRVEGTRHEAYELVVEGKKIATTRFSRSIRNNQITDGLLRQMAGQVFVSKLKFFKEMHQCTKSRDDYINYLMDSGHLD